MCIIVLAIIRERFRRLDTVLEVSPYGLAEVRPDGTRRVLPFNQRLMCRMNRWRSRVEVIPAGGRRRDRIIVDFDRVGFDRLIMCVLVLAGFLRPVTAPATPRATPPETPTGGEAPRVRRVPVAVPWRFPTLSSLQLTRFWPVMLSLATIPLAHRLMVQVQPKFKPIEVPVPLPVNALARRTA